MKWGSQLNHAWRIFGTGLSFTLFGVAGLIMGLLLFPLLFLFVRDGRKRQHMARATIGKAFGLFIRIMAGLRLLNFEISGFENLPDSGNRLIIANHPTLIDVVFLVSLFPQSECVVKQGVWKNPFMHSTVSAANYIPNEDPIDLLESCVERLAAGSSLILFPEGTRTVPGQPMSIRPGAAAIAVRANSEVLPIHLSCNPPTLGKNLPWYRVPERKFDFGVEVGRPIPVQELHAEGLSERARIRAVNERFLSLLDKAP